ncbi:inovirus Gp2 family protein [Providencia sp. 21OH12SH02B-Prov]|nr:inovirus Gp2 family protein [Providencia sp. 21OH12SH02B-Prov]
MHYPIDSYNLKYFDIIHNTFIKAQRNYTRLSVFRFDLRFPRTIKAMRDDRKVITRFIDSLKAKIAADIKRKSTTWHRKLTLDLHYVWVKEIGERNHKIHYHLMIFLNKDIYHCWGDFNRDHGCLSAMIQQAWASALQAELSAVKQSVHFCKNGVMYLNQNANELEYKKHYAQIIERAQYLCKHHTKPYHQGERLIGCNR